MGDKLGGVQLYDVVVRGDEFVTTVQRRFREFERLHRDLLEAVPPGRISSLPKLPPKHLLGVGLWRGQEEAIGERAAALECFLSKLLDESSLVESSSRETILVADFLSLDFLRLASDFLQLAEHSSPSIDRLAPGAQSCAPAGSSATASPTDSAALLAPAHYAGAKCFSLMGVLGVMRLTLGFTIALCWMVLALASRIAQRAAMRVGSFLTVHLSVLVEMSSELTKEGNHLFDERQSSSRI